MKTTTLAKLYATLATLAPSVAFSTLWEHDTDAKWDIEDPSLDPRDFQAWQTDTSARAIVDGREIEGNAYLGGTWIEFGEDPAKVNPEISGYLLQKLDEATQDLAVQLDQAADKMTGDECAVSGLYPLITQAEAVHAFLKDTMRAEYEANQVKA